MSKVHGKASAVSLGGADLSVYSNTITWGQTADAHNVTTYGKDAKVWQGGLLDGTATIGGFYDNNNTVGPRAVIKPKIGTNATLVYRPEGAGAGKPQESVDALVTGYTETPPVADMITFQVTLQFSDVVTTSTQ